MAKQNALVVKGNNVRHDQKTDYICITDLARLKDEEPAGLVANWLRSADTVDFIYEWENIYNPDFNHVEFDMIKIGIVDVFPFVNEVDGISRTKPVGH